MRKVLVVAGKPVFVIAEVPVLPSNFSRLLRRDIALEKLFRTGKEKPPEAQDEQTEKASSTTSQRTIREIRMPFWYRFKAAILRWYFVEWLPKYDVGRWAA